MESPSVVYEKMVSKYANVGSLAVLIWDILDNIPQDYRILFRGNRKKLSVATVSYIASRIGALGYSLISTIFITAPVGHCAMLRRLSSAWCPLAIGASGILFFLRLRAIYNRNRILISIFFLLWLALLAGGILIPISIQGGAVGSTMYCQDVWASPIAIYGQIAPVCFDTLIFLAISWRLSHIASYIEAGAAESGNTGRVTTMLVGTNLPAFSKSLLVDGQIYYLITVLLGIPSLVVFFNPGVPGPLQDLIGDSYTVVVNIMACRVFRRTRSGAIRESEISTSVLNQNVTSPIQFRVDAGSSVETVSKDVPAVGHTVQSFV